MNEAVSTYIAAANMISSPVHTQKPRSTLADDQVAARIRNDK